MNEAIIVTSPDDVITRINRATSELLGYDEDELVGRSLDYIVDTETGSVLQVDLPTGIPKEAFLISKPGKSIPVSYTGSVIQGQGSGAGNKVYAAQNIHRKAQGGTANSVSRSHRPTNKNPKSHAVPTSVAARDRKSTAVRQNPVFNVCRR